VYEKRVLRRMFEPKREEVQEDGKNCMIRNVKNRSIIRVIELRRIGWAGHIARMEKIRNAYKILVEKSKGSGPL